MGFLDFVFPKYCVNCKKIGSYICSDCFSFLSFDISQICLVCNKPSFNGLTHPVCEGKFTIDGAFSSIAYKGAAKKLIYNFKYKPYLSDLKKILGELFYEGLIQKEEFNRIYQNEKLILVPIPLYKSKLKSRGYNQAEILAQELVKRLDPSSCKAGLRMTMANLLERIKNTKTQVGLKQKERRENIAGAFEIKNIGIKELSDKSILLVDDVLTTGSTLLEAANVLKRSGAKKVWGLTLAKD